VSAPNTPAGVTPGSAKVPFVTSLRARPGVITIGPGNAHDLLHLRVEMPEVWDTVRIDVPASDPVLALKVHALQALAPAAARHDDYVVKLRGIEVMDEGKSLREAGALDGSIFVVTRRYRRAVR
jgi:hypothetical protein